jgi:SSS family solute:Na+ symporter
MKGADSQDYLFGKGEPWYIIGAAIFAANIGSEHLVGLAGTGAKDGVGMAHWEMQGWMILLLGWLCLYQAFEEVFCQEIIKHL